MAVECVELAADRQAVACDAVDCKAVETAESRFHLAVDHVPLELHVELLAELQEAVEFQEPAELPAELPAHLPVELPVDDIRPLAQELHTTVG